jgi:hypothetical protein
MMFAAEDAALHWLRVGDLLPAIARSWKSMMVDETANPIGPNWLLWAREIQALARTGLA